MANFLDHVIVSPQMVDRQGYFGSMPTALRWSANGLRSLRSDSGELRWERKTIDAFEVLVEVRRIAEQ